MADIFEIKFPIEAKAKENVILKFSNKQGGDYNIFSQYWQCFVWAATIGFLRNESRPIALGSERIFTLNTMIGNNGEKDARALICMCIARTGSLEIMKKPDEAIRVIAEYANGGFDHIMKLMENGENTFNDFEKVKQEIFGREYTNREVSSLKNQSVVTEEEVVFDSAAFEAAMQDIQAVVPEKVVPAPTKRRWSVNEVSDLKNLYANGLSIEKIAKFLNRTEDDVNEQLNKVK
jgi:hypothetical protein